MAKKSNIVRSVKKHSVASTVWREKRKIINYFYYIGKIFSALVSIFFFIIFLMFFASFFTSSLELSIPKGNIALVPLTGVITTGDGLPSLFEGEGISSTKVVKLLDKLKEKPEIKAVILEINSPGGSPVASAEIGQSIKELKALNVPVIAVIREVGASGGYWIASAADKIYAHELSTTGSIGVIASRLAYPGLLQEYNITYQRLISGKYKDAGSPYKEMTGEEQKLFQTVLDLTYDVFVKEVANNRNMSLEKVKELATGFVYLGSQAKELGLIDELGGRKEAIKYLEQELNITAELAEIKSQQGFLRSLGASVDKFGFNIGQGIGSSFIKSGEDSYFRVRT